MTDSSVFRIEHFRATLHWKRLQCQDRSFWKKLPSTTSYNVSAYSCRYRVELNTVSQIQSCFSKSCVENELWYGHLQNSPLQVYGLFLHMCTTCDDLWYLTLLRYQQFAERTMNFWAIFLLSLEYILQYKYVTSAREEVTKYNFHHFCDAATEVVNPQEECYHTTLLRKLQLSYCTNHHFQKTCFNRTRVF